MSDIVERLREWLSENPACMEAADEIEELRGDLERAATLIEALLGLELGSSEKAMAFLSEYRGLTIIEEAGPVPGHVWKKHK